MDKKSKILIGVFTVLILATVSVAFYKYLIKKDYYIRAEAECDPVAENCFVFTCDPDSDSECPKEPSEQTSYYKFVEKKAYTVPTCDPDSDDCPPLECMEGEDCKEILCDDDTVGEDETCNDPESYNKKNPAEETEEIEENITN